MKNVLAVIALLVVLAVPAMADNVNSYVTGAISTAAQANWQDSLNGGTLTIAVYYTGVGNANGQYVNSFVAEATLFGTAASLFTPINPAFSAPYPTAAQGLITSTVGGTYALSGLTGNMQSFNNGDAVVSTDFEVQATAASPPPSEIIGTNPALANNNILGVFQFSYAASGKTAAQIKAIVGATLFPQITNLGAAMQYDPTNLDQSAANFTGGPTDGAAQVNLLVTNNGTASVEGSIPDGNGGFVPVTEGQFDTTEDRKSVV